MMKIVYSGEVDKKAFKDIASEVIPALIEENDDVVYLDADLMACIGMTGYTEKNPDKAINCGIAEANMVGVACGMAVAGFKPYIHSFGPFASRRCYDQVFISAAYAKNAITVIGSDPGVTAAFNGGTHMPFEDIALYRVMPQASVFDISDLAQLRSLLIQAKDMPGVKYIRTPRKNPVKIYEHDAEFTPGKGVVVRDGSDVTIIASGIMVAKALSAAEKLSEAGISAAVIDMFSIKPIDDALICEYAKKTGAVVTAENHNKFGGLFSAVSEVLMGSCPVPAECVAVEDVFGTVGPQNYLEEYFGLTDEHIIEKVKLVITRK